MNDDFQAGSTLSTNPGQVLLSEAVKPEFGTPVSVWGVSVLRGHWDLNIHKVRAGTDPLQGPRRLVGRFLIDLSSLCGWEGGRWLWPQLLLSQRILEEGMTRTYGLQQQGFLDAAK